MSSSNTCSLLALPSELRIIIYELFLEDTTFRLKEQMPDNAFRAALEYNKEHHDDLSKKPKCPVSATYMDDLYYQGVVLEATRWIRGGEDHRVYNEPLASSRTTFGLLGVCRLVHREAYPVFYESAHIHWSPNPILPLSIHALTSHLANLQHVSLDYTFSAYRDKGWRFDSSGTAARELELKIAGQIEYVAMHCQNLKTFTLHLISDYFDYVHSRIGFRTRGDFLELALDSLKVDGGGRIEDSRTENGGAPWVANLSWPVAQAVNRLHARDLITMIAFGKLSPSLPCAYSLLCRGVPAAIWAEKKLSRWPGMTLSVEQAKAIDDLMSSRCGGWHRRSAIQAWFYRPEGSTVEELPKWPFLDHPRDNKYHDHHRDQGL